MSHYSDCFGKDNIIVRRYDKEYFPEPESLLLDFCNIIGINGESVELPSHHRNLNRGYSRDALEIARLSNEFLTTLEKGQLRSILQNVSIKQPFEKYTYYSKVERKGVLESYAESNACVAEKYLEDSSGFLFSSKDLSESNNSYQGLSVEAAIPIIVKALLLNNIPSKSITPPTQKTLKRKIITLLKRFF